MDPKILSAVKLDESDYKKILHPLKENNKKERADGYPAIVEQIKKARFEEEEFLPQGVWKRDYKRADWDVVSDLCIESLTKYSKDLQVMGWLCEAWFKLYGLKGARAGIILISEIVDAHWNDLLPPLDGEDDEYRQAAINWLNDRLAELIKFTPITQSESSLVKDYHFADWELSSYYERLSKKSSAQQKSAMPSKPVYAKIEDIESAIIQTPYSFHENFKNEFSLLIESIQTFEASWKKHAPKTLGLFKKTREVVQQILVFAEGKLLKRSQTKNIQKASESAGDGDDLTANASSNADKTFAKQDTRTYSFSTEAEAYQVLLDIARYLSEKHPHSPAPYLIQQAVEMGQMSFIDVMKRFYTEPGLKSLFEVKVENLPQSSKK
ncbi:MAG: type VI secretion system protein TssA [Caedimonadaceae bacterium]|nr:MAG: type VI secretion system protein TssA [Caedimonadaceae bacterium]